MRYPRLEPRDADCAAKLKKRTLTNLYNERPAWLDLAHKKLDAAVAAAYGWPADLTDEQILEKLLALNLERAAEEEKPTKAKPARTSRRSARTNSCELTVQSLGADQLCSVSKNCSSRREGLLPKSHPVPVPEGHSENSPRFQPWGPAHPSHFSPEGTEPRNENPCPKPRLLLP